ncbi:MAG: nucleotide-binding protein [Candidatus Dormibacteria bacterium]
MQSSATAAADGSAPPGVRVAFIGKGGSGKSTLSGTTCRLLARRGWPVLALDVDTLPGLAFSLGAGLLDPPPRLPLGLAELVEGRSGKRWKMVRGNGPARLVDTHAWRGPDGVLLLELGKLPGMVRPESTVAFRHVMQRYRRPGWALVADLAAGTRQPVFGWAAFASVRLAVVEPTVKSLLTLRHLSSVATHVIVNKARSEGDRLRVEEFSDLPVVAVIPRDEGVARAERSGLAVIDVAPQSAAVQALEQLVSWLVEPA